MSAEQLFSAASVVISLCALAFSTFFLARQNRHLEHERNALAILEAIGQLTDPAVAIPTMKPCARSSTIRPTMRH
jgi:hypothetical protein